MNLKPGDFIIYQKWKTSSRPGLRAKNVYPAQYGETYSYVIDKFWKVIDVFDHAIEIETRRGKRHVLDRNDHHLRKAGLFDRLFFKGRFF